MFNDLDKKSSNIYNFTIKILESGKLFFLFLLTKVEQIVARVKNQIEIEKYKWELKKKYVDLGKYISDKKLELCSKIDTEYPKYNFNKRILSKSLICKNLQQFNDNNDFINLNIYIFYKITCRIALRSINDIYKMVGNFRQDSF